MSKHGTAYDNVTLTSMEKRRVNSRQQASIYRIIDTVSEA